MSPTEETEVSQEFRPPLLSSPLLPGTRMPAARLLGLSDAVVAIAITLLVLPLVDLVPEAVREDQPPAEIVTTHAGPIGCFLLSFAVIWRIWTVHHQLFAKAETVSGATTFTNMVWLACIVFLPFPVDLIGTFGTDRFVLALYVGTLLASNLALAVLAVLLRRPVGEDSSGVTEVAPVVGNALALAVAFVIILTIPTVSYWPLAIVLLDGPVLAAIHRIRHRTGAT